MAWSKTRYAQTLDHLLHKISLVFSGNWRESEVHDHQLSKAEPDCWQSERSGAAVYERSLATNLVVRHSNKLFD